MSNEKMAYDPRSLANFVLDRSADHGFRLTNMALNKILYFSHGWYLAVFDRPLIRASFEAWEHGPVIPVIYHQFKKHKDGHIDTRATVIDLESGKDRAATYLLDQSDEDHLSRMVSFYAPKTGPVLSFMSHENGAPWDIVRSSSIQAGMVIPDRIICAYFSTKLRSKRKTGDGPQA